MRTGNSGTVAEKFADEIAALTRTNPNFSIDDFDNNLMPREFDLNNYSSLFGFGDSLADSGNAGAAIEPFEGLVGALTPAELGFVQNRFSNGPNYFDLLHAEITGAELFSFPTSFTLTDETLPFSGDVSGGVNFAFGGATVISDFGIDAPDFLRRFTFDLEAQINLLETGLRDPDFFNEPVTIADDALFAINLGGNDIFAFIEENPELEFTVEEIDTLAANFVADYRAGLEDLNALGATSFLIAGVPNAGGVPQVVNNFFGGDLQTALDTVRPVVDRLNADLEALLVDLSSELSDVEIFFFELDIEGPLNNPEAFGLDPALLTTPFTEAFQEPGSTVTLDDLPSFPFIDSIHPTMAGQEFLFEQALASNAIGGSIDSVIAGTAGEDRLIGGAGRDEIEGRASPDILLGLQADDVLNGGPGEDVLNGGPGDDLLLGGDLNDVILGRDGNDGVFGGNGADTLLGGNGDDTLNGGAGLDRVDGRDGDDFVDGGAGSDKLIGGEGADIFVFTGEGPRQRDAILDFTIGEDLIDLRRFGENGVSADDFVAIAEGAEAFGPGVEFSVGDNQTIVIRNFDIEAFSQDLFLLA